MGRVSLRSFGLALAALLLTLGVSHGGQATLSWQEEWERTVKAAEQEGQLVVYALNDMSELFLHSGFQRKFPKIKMTMVTARAGELANRIVAERRAGKFLGDVANLGNTSPLQVAQAKGFDPIATAFILPEVKDESKWWDGKHQFIDAERKYVLVYVAAPLYLVAYNTQLVNPAEFKSYWDLLNPKWKGKIAVFDLRAGGFANTRERFFYHNPELGPKFLRRLYSEMDVTFYRQYPQGEDWLATGKFALCLCRHQSISEAKSQGLPVDLIDPAQFKEGIGIESRAKTLSLFNRPPHPNAAKVFVNWFLSREGQIDFQKLSAKYIPAGAEGSLRMDIPKDDVAPRNRLVPGVKYIPQWNPELFDMEPIRKLFLEAIGESGKK
ncbi:MAG TPA: extracellular solute-binding protein [Candidatus Acidoferrales bacterium]|nr:extracellular solute-binding protein [Candidatus Acidoferrales bacterium]